MKKGRNEVEKNESRNNENDAQRKRHSVFQRNKKQIQRKMAIHRKGINEPCSSAGVWSEVEIAVRLCRGPSVELSKRARNRNKRKQGFKSDYKGIWSII